jgi:hypothetical protein
MRRSKHATSKSNYVYSEAVPGEGGCGMTASGGAGEQVGLANHQYCGSRYAGDPWHSGRTWWVKTNYKLSIGNYKDFLITPVANFLPLQYCKM